MIELHEIGKMRAAQIVEVFGTSENTRFKWMCRFRLDGQAGLSNKSAAGEAPLRGGAEIDDLALMGLPVVSAPVFMSPRSRPFGLQLMARRYNDLLICDFIDDLAGAGGLPKCAA